MRAEAPGLGSKIQLRYEQQSPNTESLFAVCMDAAWDDTRGACGRATPVLHEAPPVYARLIAARGDVGKAG